MSLDKFSELKKKIELLTIEEKIEVFNILKQNDVKYTQNKNGVFIILNNIDDTIITKLEKFLVFLNDTKKKTKEIENIMVNLNKLKN